jgi:aldehyde dehydrogenase (NAD+)
VSKTSAVGDTSDTSANVVQRGLHIAGREIFPADSEVFQTIDPSRGVPVASYIEAGAPQVDEAIDAARTAFISGEWSSLSPTRRGRLMMAWGDLILDQADLLGELETRENGKLLREMQGQLKAVPEWLYYFGGLADKVEGRVIPVENRSVLNYTLREPLGVVGVLKPWNSPSLISMLSLAPALATGNTVVLKPSEFAPGSALELAKLAEAAGLPKGVVNVVTGGPTTGTALVGDQRVAKVAFTGGSKTGRQIAKMAGSRLARCTLELGGKNANIVFPDADLEAAEAGILAGIFAAAGQSCVAGSRALLHEEIYDELVQRLVKRAAEIRLGDPLDPDTEMGPIANARQLARVEKFVDAARSEGAEVLAGGRRGSVKGLDRGLFYEPTVIHQAASTSPIAQEEVFGPVLTVFPFKSEEEAVAMANDTHYGLATGVWTLNLQRAHRVAQALQTGTVWVNMYRAIAFNSPQGGYKDSGIGRENGVESVLDYLQTKSVWCELSSQVQDPFTLRTD